MKITCNREKLLAAFQTAAAVAPARSPKTVLQNVKLDVSGEEATFSATDLEIGIRVTTSGIEAKREGSAILPTSRFGAILRELSDEQIEIETDERGVFVRGAHSVFNLPAENPDTFPNVASFSEEKYHEISARLLREVIRRTAFATDAESTRFALGGVMLELSEKQLVAVGTDGRRLAKMEAPAQALGGHAAKDGACIIPTKAMHLIERAFSDADAEVALAARTNDVMVRSARVTIYSRLVEGRFPKWRDVIPDRSSANKIDMVVGPFAAAVRQAAIVTSEDTKGIDFAFGSGKLVLSCQAAETGESRVELPIAYDGEPITITLNPKFVLDFLKVLDADKTVAAYVTDSASAVVCATEDGYDYVIMPLARDN